MDAVRGPSAPADPQTRPRAIGSAGERLVHTEEVTGSIPVSPTQLSGRFRAAWLVRGGSLADEGTPDDADTGPQTRSRVSS